MIAARNISKVIWIHTILIIAIGLLALYSASFNNNVVGVSVFYDQLFCARAWHPADDFVEQRGLP